MGTHCQQVVGEERSPASPEEFVDEVGKMPLDRLELGACDRGPMSQVEDDRRLCCDPWGTTAGDAGSGPGGMAPVRAVRLGGAAALAAGCV